ncbi:MAG: Mn transporter [Nitrospirae bacterium CG_4_9_14_3_um_filter_53_35]|nr:MAG: Mn transporter [Nitrospirae bacterium CG2_30_53_67]PIS37841.1 MAG: Mn transporter [Nitrospirae bacterium CG08_land_8_20_14_0_20_52_24]PIV85398.1 MAG: Mn transporter [Nitrospirae bacterium CG17_big_fil_post_rev_8_21_14_2_50_50_9]PIW85153.1 MAG: Mn transporter [Nitrospirae bacterium CG_4_8_14_3_um_filter_50_41]PIX86753.1 MAG: Mn transporter [Nitrospirae bacterium CG_4_10_14_3_um_filter_53_41]PJA74207.1 MAG: Mn transporter [Nitrospirae bacterium CG_4_9_14_3_um_filter_53_35]
MLNTRTKSILKKIRIFISVMGPGIITANVDNDAGGIATYTVAGAHFGYSLLWSFIPIIFVLIVVQEMASRMAVVTGKGLADLIREEMGVKVTFYAMVVLIVANIGNVMAEFAGIAASADLFGIRRSVLIILCALFVWWLVVKGNYKSVEKVFLVACIFYLSYIISGFVTRPDWSEVARQTVRPQLHMNKVYLVMLIGLIGTTIAPWMQFYQQASVVEKGIKLKEYAYHRLDVIIGAFIVNIVAFFIIVVCAGTLFKHGIMVETAKDAALALKPLAGDYCYMLFAFGLFNASLFAASILPLSTAYSVCEGMGWELGVNKHFREAPQFYSLYTGIIILGAVFILIPNISLVKIMFFSQVANGLLLPFVLILMLRLVNNKRLMGEFVNSRVYNMAAWLTVILMIVLSLALLFFMCVPG